MTEQDQRVLSMVIDAGQALVLAFNKWDLVDEGPPLSAGPRDRSATAPIAVAPRVNISAMTGRAVQKLVPAMETALDSWDARIPPDSSTPGSKRSSRRPAAGARRQQPRILFATQATARPPTFVLFTSGFRGRVPAVSWAPAA